MNPLQDAAEGEAVEGNERGFRIGWIVFNAFALLGLLVAVILFLVKLGFWSMTYTPIHLVQGDNSIEFWLENPL